MDGSKEATPRQQRSALLNARAGPIEPAENSPHNGTLGKIRQATLMQKGARNVTRTQFQRREERYDSRATKASPFQGK
jgi:hypothetical protein